MSKIYKDTTTNLLYEFIDIAIDLEENLTPVVVCKCLKTGKIYTTPTLKFYSSRFEELVEEEKVESTVEDTQCKSLLDEINNLKVNMTALYLYLYTESREHSWFCPSFKALNDFQSFIVKDLESFTADKTKEEAL